MQVQKKLSPQGSENTQASPPHFYDPRSKKKIRLGPKNMYRSKKKVPRSKKHASQKPRPRGDQLGHGHGAIRNQAAGPWHSWRGSLAIQMLKDAKSTDAHFTNLTMAENRSCLRKGFNKELL